MSQVLSGRVNNFSFLAGRVGSGEEIFKSHVSGRVGSRVFRISRVGSGRGGSIHEVFKMSRVGSSHDT